MKALCITIILVFSISCKNPDSKQKDIDTSSIDTKIVDDTIFLDYRFGMTKNEFSDHTKQLISDRKLSDSGLYDFKLDTPSKTYIQPYYHNNKLYNLKLVVEPTNNQYSNASMLFYELSVFYSKKYHIEKFVDGVAYRYEDDNMILNINNNIETPFIEYTKKSVDSIIRLEKEAEKSKLQNDI